jgi:glycosyltransferase involved in cell wall biosynthesis
LFVGSFVIGKGSAFLTLLHEQIVSGNDKVIVTVCSPSPVPEIVRTAMPAFRFISQLGSEALVREYNGADLFMLPSLYEAFEMSSLEALACGTPIMLNNTGARPTLESLGCPGVFCLEDADSPRQAIESARMKFKGMRRQALGEWTRQRFDVDLLEGRLLEICGFNEVEDREAK